MTNCHRLKLQADDGKMRLTDTANTEGILRIIQSIPSPKAEPFKQWLAQLGADRIHDLEAAEAFNKEIDARIAARHDVKQQNVALADAAFAAGVKTNLDFSKFQNSGYMGLYGGETAGDIKRRKKLKPNQEILDHMSSVELGANLFRITQAEDKPRRENVSNKEAANKVHYEVGRTVRKTIEALGGTMPEQLPIDLHLLLLFFYSSKMLFSFVALCSPAVRCFLASLLRVLISPLIAAMRSAPFSTFSSAS